MFSVPSPFPASLGLRHVRAVIQQFSQARLPYLQGTIDWPFGTFRIFSPHQQEHYWLLYCAIA